MGIRHFFYPVLWQKFPEKKREKLNSMFAWTEKDVEYKNYLFLSSFEDSIEEIFKELDIWLRLKTLVLTQDEHL